VNVLILDGNENQAVACVRSLGRAGHSVWVGSDAAWAKAGWSRWSRGTIRYVSPKENTDAFVASIVSAVKRIPGALVLPMTERSTLPISLHRDALEAVGGRVALAPHETIVTAFDKAQTTRLAAQLGIATPATELLESRADAASFAARCAYPVVLKPSTSEMVVAGVMRSTGAPAYARSSEQLLEAYDDLTRKTSRVLAQEYVEGTGVGYFALMREGELRAEFAHRRIRDVRPTGSGSAVRESTRPDPRVRDAAVSILRALSWHGVAMVEFRRRPDGTPVFLEINGRFWNSLALAVYAGADFPRLLVEMTERGDVAPATDYRVGVRCRWLLGDARHLVAVLRGRPAGYTGAFPGRWATIFEVLRPVPGTRHDNFTVDDPLPEVGDWLDMLVRRVPEQMAKRWSRSPARSDGGTLAA
jgi:predicted ATP-grasp superfamily ATP-dependent carboligase